MKQVTREDFAAKMSELSIGSGDEKLHDAPRSGSLWSRPTVERLLYADRDEGGGWELRVLLTTGVKTSTTVLPEYIESHDDLEYATGWTWDDAGGEDAYQLRQVFNEVNKNRAENPLPAWQVSDYLSTQGKLNPEKLAALIEHGTRFRMGHDNKLWRYVGFGAFRPDGEALVRRRALFFLPGTAYATSRVNTMVRFFEDRESLTPMPAEPDPEKLNLRNGVLDWRTGELGSHSADGSSFVQLPVDWIPNAECPAIDAFLHDVFPPDAVPFAYELAGYFLMAGNPMQKAFLLLGPGGNGKTTFLKLLLAAMGQSNCSSTPLHLFGAERGFHLAGLYGKLANVCGDLDATELKRSGMFKQLTGGDVVNAEHKGRDTFDFRPFAKLIFSANESPLASDTTDGYFDRWVIIPFDKRIRGTVAEDPFITDKLTTRSELAGFTRHAVAGLQTLMDRGHFKLPESVQGEARKYRSKLDNTVRFIEEYVEACDPFEDEKVFRTLVMAQYRGWCKTEGEAPASAQRMGAKLKELFPRMQETGSGGTTRWAGVRLVTSNLFMGAV